MDRGSFRDPPWDAPLDPAAELRRIPEAATQKGMMIAPMAIEARKRGFTLPSARERYVPFQDYPLREHAQLLLETARVFYPDLPLRQSLRRLGRAAVTAFVDSTVGKVVFSTVTDPHSAFEAVLKGYSIAVQGCTARMIDRGPQRAVLRLEHLYYFLDSHHIGCIEGAMRTVGAQGRIRIRVESASATEFLAEW